MTSRKPIALALAATVVATGAFSAAAVGQGETVEIKTAIKIRTSFPAFHGKVTADNENCVEERTVRLYREKRGGGKQLLGKDRTSNSGKWKVKVAPKSGAYFAVVEKVTEGTAGTIYVCLKDKSRTVTVD